MHVIPVLQNVILGTDRRLKLESRSQRDIPNNMVQIFGMQRGQPNIYQAYNSTFTKKPNMFGNLDNTQPTKTSVDN